MERQRDLENYTYGQTEKHKNVQKDGQRDENMSDEWTDREDQANAHKDGQKRHIDRDGQIE